MTDAHRFGIVASAPGRTLPTEDGIGWMDIAIMAWRTSPDRQAATKAVIGRTYIVITAWQGQQPLQAPTGRVFDIRTSATRVMVRICNTTKGEVVKRLIDMVWRFIQFFEICEGGYFRRPQTSRYVCLRCLSMYVCLQACMYVWDRKSSSQGWVRFLTENVQYWTFYSIFWDLWGGGTSGGPRHTYMLTANQPRMISKSKRQARMCLTKTLYLSTKLKHTRSNIHAQKTWTSPK